MVESNLGRWASRAVKSFELHPRLARECHLIADLPVATLLLMDDARYPWCILVPRIPGMRDLHDLPRRRRGAFMDEVDRVARVLQARFRAEKINVAALGNQVPQLHVHVIARHSEDAAWPAPVWGVGTQQHYPAEDAARIIAELRAALDLAGDPQPRV